MPDGPENPYDADCLRLIRKLQETPERQLPHSLLLKRMKMDAKSFQKNSRQAGAARRHRHVDRCDIWTTATIAQAHEA
jgi:hypothetical protein